MSRAFEDMFRNITPGILKNMQADNKVKNGQHNNTMTLEQETYAGEEGHSNINVRETERETVEIQVEGNNNIGTKDNDYGSDNAVALGDCLKQLGTFLLELREVFRTTIEATNFVAEKVSKMLQLVRKYFSHRIKKVLIKAGPLLSHDAGMILDSERSFLGPVQHLKRKKLCQGISVKN